MQPKKRGRGWRLCQNRMLLLYRGLTKPHAREGAAFMLNLIAAHSGVCKESVMPPVKLAVRNRARPARRTAGKVALDDVWATIDEIGQTNKEMQAAIKETQRIAGDLGNKFGDEAEYTLAPGLQEKFKRIGFGGVHSAAERTPHFRSNQYAARNAGLKRLPFPKAALRRDAGLSCL
jgi:hypothetical protein